MSPEEAFHLVERESRFTIESDLRAADGEEGYEWWRRLVYGAILRFHKETGSHAGEMFSLARKLDDLAAHLKNCARRANEVAGNMREPHPSENR